MAHTKRKCPKCGAMTGVAITYCAPEGRLTALEHRMELARRGYKLLFSADGKILNTVCQECHCLWHSATENLTRQEIDRFDCVALC